jgi:multidrug resistance efflux pump
VHKVTTDLLEPVKATLDEAQLNLGFTQVVSPIDGVAGIKNIDFCPPL